LSFILLIRKQSIKKQAAHEGQLTKDATGSHELRKTMAVTEIFSAGGVKVLAGSIGEE
jgi:hypothetical protein